MMANAKEESSSGFNIPDVSHIDANKLSSRYGKVNKGPEFILPNTRGRDIWGRLTFNTGVFWLGGFAVGGSYGIVESSPLCVLDCLILSLRSLLNFI